MAPKGVKCNGCGNKIDPKEPTVEAMKKKYHKNCFACVNCNKTIAGTFHPVDNKPWCDPCFIEKQAARCADCLQPITGTVMKTDDGRTFHDECLKNLSKGLCAACKTKIAFLDPVVEALGQSYHDDCFRCAECKGEVPASFHAHNGHPYCEKCYRVVVERKSPVCAECVQPIVKGTRVEVLGKAFHEECFPLASWGPCNSCNSKVLLTEPSVKVKKLDRYWHLGCMNCAACNGTIRTPFYLQENKPCCESCYIGHIAPKCGACARPIADNQLKAMKQVWHPDCFVCAVCQDVLYKLDTEFFNVQGRPYCKRDVEAAMIPIVA